MNKFEHIKSIYKVIKIELLFHNVNYILANAWTLTITLCLSTCRRARQTLTDQARQTHSDQNDEEPNHVLNLYADVWRRQGNMLKLTDEQALQGRADEKRT